MLPFQEQEHSPVFHTLQIGLRQNLNGPKVEFDSIKFRVRLEIAKTSKADGVRITATTVSTEAISRPFQMVG